MKGITGWLLAFFHKQMGGYKPDYSDFRINPVELPPVTKEWYEDTPALIGAFLTLLFFGGIIGYSLYFSRSWDKGIYPRLYRNSRKHRFDAFVCLGVNILRFETEEINAKLHLLKRFLAHRFPRYKRNLLDTYKIAMQDPVTTESLCKWLLRKGIEEEELKALFETLFSMAVSDGKMAGSEYQELRLFCSLMGLSVQELDEKTAESRRAYQKAEEERRENAIRDGAFADYAKQRYLRTMGLKDTFTITELKKSYRLLAKSCHPDMIRTSTPQEKEQLNRRFLEIQEAYEYLLKLV